MHNSKKHLLEIVFVSLAIVVIQINAHTPGGPCLTPRQEDGVCVPIKTCGFLVRLLHRFAARLPARIVALVNDSKCGDFDNTPYVCCRQNDVIAEFSKNHPSIARSAVEVQTGMAILNAIDCGNSDYDKVAGGVDVYPAEFPWMVLLIYAESGTCGGSLITDQYVLTAAHCIKEQDVVRVRLGEHDTKKEIDCVGKFKQICSPPTQEIEIEEAIYHKEYKSYRRSNDIGLLRLARKANIINSVQPICLPITEHAASAELERLIIAGWGLTKKTDSSVLQKATVPYQPIEECKSVYKLYDVSDNQICAGGIDNIDVCQGDSGGPIFWPSRYEIGVKWIQFGLASHGGGECGSRFPGIYTKTHAYLSWIAGNIRP